MEDYESYTIEQTGSERSEAETAHLAERHAGWFDRIKETVAQGKQVAERLLMKVNDFALESVHDPFAQVQPETPGQYLIRYAPTAAALGATWIPKMIKLWQEKWRNKKDIVKPL